MENLGICMDIVFFVELIHATAPVNYIMRTIYNSK